MYKCFERILAYVSKKINIDLKYFINNGFWSSLSLFFEIILSLLLTYYLANYLSEENVGKYYFVFSLVGFFTIFTLKGFLTIGINAFIKHKYDAYEKITKLRVNISLFGSILIIIIGFITDFYLGFNLFWYLLLISIYLPLSNFSIYWRYLYSLDRLKLISLISITKNIIIYVPTVVFIFLDKHLLLIIGYFLLVQNIFDIICYYKFKPKHNNKEFIFKKKDIINGLFFSIKDITNTVSSYLDKIILPIIFDLKLLAVYSISLIIPKTLNNVFDKFYLLLFYKKLSKNKFKIFNIKLIIFFILNCLLTVILIIIIPFIIKNIFPNYLDSIFYSQLLVGILPLNLMNILFQKLFETRNKAKEVFYLNIIIQTFQIILYIILIPLFSIYGAIIARYLKDICTFIISIYYISKVI